MTTQNRSMSEYQVPDPQALQRAIRLVLGALLVSIVLFAGYYVWDRYVHLGDQSPVERSIAHMEEAIRQEPQNVEARVVMADYYLFDGRNAEALDQATQVLNVQPDQVDALLIAGIAHARLGNASAALAPLQRVVALRQEGAMPGADMALEAAYYFLAESYLKLDRPEEAIPALEAALAINPVDADALYQLGQAYQANGQAEAALEPYHRAVRLVPDFVEVYRAMADCYVTLNQPGGRLYAQGMVAFSQGNYAAAQADLESAAEILPGFAPLHLGLGLVYEKLGHLETARASVQRALALNPDDLASQQAMGRIQASLDAQR